MKRMKSQILTLLLFLVVIFSTNYADAQILDFCEGVDDFGNPIGSSSVFNVGADGGYLFFLVRLQEPLGCDHVNYLLYDVDYNGNEDYNTTIEQVDIGPNWRFFWRKVTFYKAGTYKVYVEDCYGYVLTSSTIKIKTK
ncbi:MAG: hypothetical protein PHH30_10775 [Bacteroidales bacterium]|nr:hypothetical protein [Bacteroidales bacterium]